jgi:fatty-acyl-CoA synthase
MLLADTLRKACQFFPRKEAIICGNRRWTYEEFFQRLSRFSDYLKGAGIEKGDRVAILHPNCHCFLEVYYAIALRGAAAVPLNYRLSAGELSVIINDAGARALIADPRFRQTVDQIRTDLPTVGKIIWTGDKTGELPDGGRDLGYEEIVAGLSAPVFEVDVQETDIAQIYYTSGTTEAAPPTAAPSERTGK